LTTIYGVCGLLRENADSLPKEQQMKLLGQVQEDADSLIHMVQNLLMVTKANTDGVYLQKQETVLEELIDSTLMKFKKHYPEQAVQTSIPEEFISIPMDPMLIQQVLLNLLENAVIHAAGMTQLCLSVSVKGNRVVFTVQDDGCGIPKEKEANLFNSYGQAGELPADGRRAGMGIGLSVCASIIQAHGGEIWGGNHKKGGTQIQFALELEETDFEQ
jgi:two-component system sensor histidine kinase KdpD